MSELSIKIEVNAPEVGLDLTIPASCLITEEVISVRSQAAELYRVVEAKAAGFVLSVKGFCVRLHHAVHRVVWKCREKFHRERIRGGRGHFALAGGLRL